MIRLLSSLSPSAGLVLLAALSAAPAHADETLPVPHRLAVAGSQTAAEPVILAARRYAAFWDRGDPELARVALAADFTDRTLPTGRSQGPTGPLQASQTFRRAVPDLRVEIEDMVVAGDRVALQLHFRGHFTGQFLQRQGQGQVVDFHAFDLYRVADGRIAENWHLEDNLTLLQQLGVVSL